MPNSRCIGTGAREGGIALNPGPCQRYILGVNNLNSRLLVASCPPQTASPKPPRSLPKASRTGLKTGVCDAMLLWTSNIIDFVIHYVVPDFFEPLCCSRNFYEKLCHYVAREFFMPLCCSINLCHDVARETFMRNNKKPKHN